MSLLTDSMFWRTPVSIFQLHSAWDTASTASCAISLGTSSMSLPGPVMALQLELHIMANGLVLDVLHETIEQDNHLLFCVPWCLPGVTERMCLL